MKDLTVESSEDFAEKIPDITTFGPPDLFKLASKASSESGGWMKSTKVANTVMGCLVQVTTQQGDHVAEALTFCPGLRYDFDARGFKAATVHPIPL